MKKVLLLCGAILSGVYALGSLVFFIGALLTYNITTPGGLTEIAAHAVPPAIGGALCLICVERLRRKPPTNT
jgi:hypothetical protein